ncbi:unnamed protein product [Didymodactylos carnosus]|uniref:Uncharacterized protein n=1 Tax=Didymodactylos carnosus TaxID=1234261 RepID=A0A8S2IRF7_9BILA|nr:unnamed protein product [Didymodactylos carnosus]CAF3768143.1 unnamed protein product [Didymodactylos carnosus]
MLSKRAVMLLQLKFNFFYRRPSIIARNANNYSAEPFLKDHMITHLISSEKDQWTVKMFRDMYERLLLEKQTVVEKQIKLSEIYEQQFLSANTEKMFYQGILHSRAAFESFEGYLRGIIDRSGALGRMAREKLIIQALQRMKKGKTLSPQMEKTLTEIVRCHFKTEVEHLTTEDLQILDPMCISHIDYSTIYCWLNMYELVLLLNNSPHLIFFYVALYGFQKISDNDDVYQMYSMLRYLHVEILDIPFDFIHLLLRHLPQLCLLSIQGSCKDLDFIDGDYWCILFQQNLFFLSKFRLNVRVKKCVTIVKTN